jgi:uncharacterized protein
MMDDEFIKITDSIINDDKYQSLKKEPHHGISRYEHSMRVAKLTYIRSKKKNLDYVQATRAALLHDYFNKSELKTKWLKTAYEHPIIAYNNAKDIFALTEKEGNIIRSHMFPMCKELPKSREAWIVTFVDKKIAMYECIKYKFSPKNIRLYIINIISKKLPAKG